MEWLPGARVERVSVATPPELSVALPMVVPPSAKVTVPVAVPPSLLMVAVSVSGVE